MSKLDIIVGLVIATMSVSFLVGCSSSETKTNTDEKTEDEIRLEELYADLANIKYAEERIQEIRDELYDGNWDNDDPELVEELEELEELLLELPNEEDIEHEIRGLQIIRDNRGSYDRGITEDRGW